MPALRPDEAPRAGLHLPPCRTHDHLSRFLGIDARPVIKQRRTGRALDTHVEPASDSGHESEVTTIGMTVSQ